MPAVKIAIINASNNNVIEVADSISVDLQATIVAMMDNRFGREDAETDAVLFLRGMKKFINRYIAQYEQDQAIANITPSEIT
jgi:cystathionine beta-lyase/cystathionine gamma-synthase